MSQFFTSGGQSIGYYTQIYVKVSFSISVFSRVSKVIIDHLFVMPDYFLVWQNIYNIKFIILTIFKAICPFTLLYNHYHHRLLPVSMLSHFSHVRLTFCDPMDCSLPGSSLCGIHQTRILEWVGMPSSQPRDQICVSYVSCTGRWVLYHFHYLGRPSSIYRTL